ncbi:MAG: ABC transporter ATP-binding protein [Alphaproteobacteria bacterium]|nr:ABC transporter ATP-binding protein [Alphaproteobacteria bacterium]
MPTALAEEAMVRLDSVSKAYGAVQALRPIDLDVRRGELLTLLGPSGSGKTTVLNMIAGMTGPSAGRVWIDGRDVTEVPPSKRGIGMVFQHYALMPHMTVYQNIAFPLEVRRTPADEIRRRVTKVLETVRLPNIAGRKPKELSGGQQQRVSLARCIVYNPSLILMDEPLGALDKNLRDQMQLEIRRIHQELGITIIYVTHDQEEALNMSDRIMLMNGGAVEQLDTPHDLYYAPHTKFAAEFIGRSSLVPADIVGDGQAKTEDGTVVRFNRGARAGHGHLMVRPENMRLVRPDQVEAGLNTLKGTLQGTLVTGASITHYVALSAKTTLVVQELANERRTAFAAGDRVSVTWPVDAGIFLDR